MPSIVSFRNNKPSNFIEIKVNYFEEIPFFNYLSISRGYFPWLHYHLVPHYHHSLPLWYNPLTTHIHIIHNRHTCVLRINKTFQIEFTHTHTRTQKHKLNFLSLQIDLTSIMMVSLWEKSLQSHSPLLLHRKYRKYIIRESRDYFCSSETWREGKESD